MSEEEAVASVVDILGRLYPESREREGFFFWWRGF